MKDYIVRAMAADGKIRAFAATTRELTEYARSIHNTSPVATAALGRLLTAGSMMGVMMKGDKDLLTLQIRGDGPIEGIIVTADNKANVKGYVFNSNVIIHANDKGKLDVRQAIGAGILNVIRDVGLKEPYVGQTVLVSGEIAEDITYYYATSEQTPSSVGLGVLMNKDNTVKQSGGFIIQLMPNITDEVIDKLEKRIGEISSVTEMLEKGMSPEDILEYILGDMDLEITDKIPTQFYCNCTKERVEKAIISIGRKDIQEMIDEDKPIEVNCHFCNTAYNFSVDELRKMVKSGI